MDPQIIQSHFAASAPTYDQWRQRNQFYHQDLIKLCRFYITPGLRVLEIGCATGHLLNAVQPSLGVGIDWAEPMVTYASQNYPQYHFYCLDAATCSPLDLRSDQRQFDVILLADVLGYVPDIQQLLTNLQDFCQDHTRILMTFHNFLWEPLLHLAERLGQRRPQPPQNWLSMSDTLNLLQITGYIPIHQGQRFLVPKPIPGVSSLINRFIAPLPLINHLCLTQYILARKMPVPQDPQTLTCSIVVPARNEAGNITPLVARCPVFGKKTELIFVEGHSRDQTWEVIQEVIQKTPQSERFKILALQQKGVGKGDAVRLGFEVASGDILMILDADMTVQPEDLIHFWEVIVSGRGEVINGSRLVYPHSHVAMPFINRLANKFFAFLFSYLLGRPIKDTLCGTKVLWRRDYDRIAAGRSYFGDFDPFGDFDLLFGAARLGLQCVDVPVRYQPRSYGQSNIAHVREGLILLKMCWLAAQKLKFF